MRWECGCTTEHYLKWSGQGTSESEGGEAAHRDPRTREPVDFSRHCQHVRALRVGLGPVTKGSPEGGDIELSYEPWDPVPKSIPEKETCSDIQIEDHRCLVA